MAGGRRKLKKADVHDLLISLIDKSLVSIEETPTGQRYRFLESVRDYLRDTHGGSAESAEMRKRHRSFFLDLTAQMEPKLTGGEAGASMDVLEAEHDNIRAAQDNALTEEPLEALRIIKHVGRFWDVRGHLVEGIDRTNRALAASKEGADSVEAAGALLAMAKLLMMSGRYEEAEKSAVRGLTIYQAHGDMALVARAHFVLGTIATNQGDFERSLENLSASRRLYESLDMRDQLPGVANSMGIAHAHAGKFGQAAEYFEEAIELARANGSKTSVSGLTNIGIVRFALCDYDKATRFCEEALEMAKALGDRQSTANCTNILGAIACSKGEHAEARRLLTQSITMADAVGFLTSACDGRFYLSVAEYEMGHEGEARILLAPALKGYLKVHKNLEIVRCLTAGALFYCDARLLGAADRLRAEAGVVLTEDDRRRCEGIRLRLRGSLGDEAFEASVGKGERLSLDEASQRILAGR